MKPIANTQPPIIGVTTRVIHASGLGPAPAGVADAPLWGVFADYCESISAAGGLPMMLSRCSDPVAIVRSIDALLLSGGEDVEPTRYGQPIPVPAPKYDSARDAFELALAQAALDAGLPILAICRGCQLLNVVLGGTLIAHLDDIEFDHANTDEPRSALRHQVRVSNGSLLEQALGCSGSVGVNSYHHQAVADTGQGAVVNATAFDGTIEGFELPGRPVLAVQWHPEMHAGTDPIFTWFIDAARAAMEVGS